MASVFEEAKTYLPKEPAYRLLPFRFIRLDSARYVAVNEVGEWHVLTRAELEHVVRKTLPPDGSLFMDLKAKHFLEDQDSDVAVDLLVLKRRTKQARVSQFRDRPMTSMAYFYPAPALEESEMLMVGFPPVLRAPSTRRF